MLLLSNVFYCFMSYSNFLSNVVTSLQRNLKWIIHSFIAFTYGANFAAKTWQLAHDLFIDRNTIFKNFIHTYQSKISSVPVKMLKIRINVKFYQENLSTTMGYARISACAEINKMITKLHVTPRWNRIRIGTVCGQLPEHFILLWYPCLSDRELPSLGIR